MKFSPREDGHIATRWRDILIAEHLASETLREAGLPATSSTIYGQDRRCFLEVTRFDRAGMYGRLPMLSLAQLDAEFVGHGSDWADAMQSLAEQGLVDQVDCERTLQYQWFGQWMGNTDMHLSDRSLAPSGAESSPEVTLQPRDADRTRAHPHPDTHLDWRPSGSH